VPTPPPCAAAAAAVRGGPASWLVRCIPIRGLSSAVVSSSNLNCWEAPMHAPPACGVGGVAGAGVHQAAACWWSRWEPGASWVQVMAAEAAAAAGRHLWCTGSEAAVAVGRGRPMDGAVKAAPWCHCPRGSGCLRLTITVVEDVNTTALAVFSPVGATGVSRLGLAAEAAAAAAMGRPRGVVSVWHNV
jgi:hypothetical protein